ncbi:hypothetical protein BJ508DRAFT_35533 [Ascobolus immersus RN42]|uniref:Uncharacterized protein n=1 Tax=Ascobolus immersus RN42 TaxID=1160509 RepID=A0A3N4HM74_ASCIM|nr:hypothetical protein BJ508DRAFT_35533 [Ascobolus immersus RN42]
MALLERNLRILTVRLSTGYRPEQFSGPVYQYFNDLEARSKRSDNLSDELQALKRELARLYNEGHQEPPDSEFIATRSRPYVLPPLFLITERYFAFVLMLIFVPKPADKKYHQRHEDFFHRVEELKGRLLSFQGDSILPVLRATYLYDRYQAGLFREAQAKIVEFVLLQLMRSMALIIKDWQELYLHQIDWDDPKVAYSYPLFEAIVLLERKSLRRVMEDARDILGQVIFLRSERLEQLLLKYIEEDDFNVDVARGVKDATLKRLEEMYGPEG